MPLSIHLEPISFNTTEDPWLPQYQPYSYQYEVLKKTTEVIEQGKTLCIFLVTPTGSGKTLASYAYSILRDRPTIGIYPTNELIRDQEATLETEYQRVQGLKKSVLRIDSKQLDEWGIDLEQPSHADALETIMSWQKVMLTNPDILYFLTFGRYPERSYRAGQRQRLLESLAQYPIWVFDEFHLYNVKQSANIAFLVSALHAINPSKGRVFIFASATPEVEARHLLADRLGLEVAVVEAQRAHGSEKQRMVAHPIDLVLIPSNLNRWEGIDTIIDNLTLVHDFLSEYPEARVVTIVDSVAGAIHLTNTLKETFLDKSVGEVHGFSSDAERAQALRKQFTVGTSTIEVGIDLKDETEKDMLIFEARTSSQFVQRLGRIGRHSKQKNIPNKVLAVVPDYVYNDLMALGGQPSITRADLYEKLEEAYRVPEDFSRYLKKHAIVEMTEGRRFLSTLFQPDDKQNIMEAIDSSTEALTRLSSNVGWARWNEYT